MDDIFASDAAAILPVWLQSALADWPRPQPGDEAAFFAGFTAAVPQDGTQPLITGYYEPEIEARLAPEPGFRHPLYSLPSNPGFSHAEIAAGALAGQGLELAWIADPVDAFFLQVQGSGRLRLPDGILRLGYAGKNGHPYCSLGREMIARGLLPAQGISARAIRDWLAAHPDQTPDLLLTNPSFVYFRPLDLAPDEGPLGTAGVPLTAMRSLAVDPAHIPLGALVLLETRIGDAEIRRLMVAQDTGGVIRGAQRADIFFGTGDKAGEAAGAQNAPGRLTVLLPGQT